MVQLLNLDILTRRHAERLLPFVDQFRAVGPDAIEAIDGTFGAFVQSCTGGRSRQRTQSYALTQERAPYSVTWDAANRIDAESLMSERLLGSPPPARRPLSRLAIAAAIRPVQDLYAGDLRLLRDDQALDFVGPPYADVWSKTIDTVPDAGNWQDDRLKAWADVADGAFGFDNAVKGTVGGRSRFCGAAVYAAFIPRPGLGFAQIRPFVDYDWQWSDISFKSREHTSAGFGILVWSWNAQGGDAVLEQDYRYSAWDDWCAADYFNTHNSPSWVTGGAGAGWDNDYAFIPQQSPYFAIRPNRIYEAAVWCFGECFSHSPENRPGGATGSIRARVPWIVIGSQ